MRRFSAAAGMADATSEDVAFETVFKRTDESELKYAEWVSRESIELQPLDYSLTNEMMKLFKEHGYEKTRGEIKKKE